MILRRRKNRTKALMEASTLQIESINQVLKQVERLEDQVRLLGRISQQLSVVEALGPRLDLIDQIGPRLDLIDQIGPRLELIDQIGQQAKLIESLGPYLQLIATFHNRLSDFDDLASASRDIMQNVDRFRAVSERSSTLLQQYLDQNHVISESVRIDVESIQSLVTSLQVQLNRLSISRDNDRPQS
jgi:hypothetical protein